MGPFALGRKLEWALVVVEGVCALFGALTELAALALRSRLPWSVVFWNLRTRSSEEPLDSSAEMLETARGALVESMGRGAVVPVVPILGSIDMMVSTTGPASARLWARDAQKVVEEVVEFWSAP